MEQATAHRIRPVRPEEFDRLLSIINQAAEAYRGNIPADCWHEPYMSEEQLRAEMAAGVNFVGIHIAGQIAAVMGMQQVRNVELIRHAYVVPEHQGEGLGGELIETICGERRGQMLVGTWRAAQWAIRFYERHGFVLLPPEIIRLLLRTYWSITERQAETSVVLARPALDEPATVALVAAS
jgi:GNAT superfamily N-acetyltransferase